MNTPFLDETTNRDLPVYIDGEWYGSILTDEYSEQLYTRCQECGGEGEWEPDSGRTMTSVESLAVITCKVCSGTGQALFTAPIETLQEITELLTVKKPIKSLGRIPAGKKAVGLNKNKLQLQRKWDEYNKAQSRIKELVDGNN